MWEVAEQNELTDLTFNTRRTRKIVRVNVGDELTKVDDIVRPFMALSHAIVAAKDRDPLTILEQRLVEDGADENTVRRVFTSFRENGSVIDG